MVDRPAVVDVYMHLDCGSYTACIDTLRHQLAHHPQRDEYISLYGDWINQHPLLPEQEAFQPKRWMYVNFIMKGTRKTTLAIRGDNVYVMGFSNMDGKWYELGIKGQNKQFITGSTLLGCGVRYGSLLASDSENGPAKLLDEVTLGKRSAKEAVSHLSSYNADPGFQAKRETKQHLVCLILMISEATRMFPHYERVIHGWITGINLKEPEDQNERLLKYLTNWENISNAMIGREGYSKTLQNIGIKDQDSAFGVVYLMLNSTTRKTKKNQLSSPTVQGNDHKGGGGAKGRKGGWVNKRGQDGKGGRAGKGRHDGKSDENGNNKPPSKQGATEQRDEEEPPLSSGEESQLQQQHEEEPALPIPTGQTPNPLSRESEEEVDYDVNSDGNDDEKDDELADLGQLLVEVFSVRASSGVVDTIAVFDGKRGQIIYNHDGEGDAGIDTQTQRYLELTGPYEAISADGRVAIQVSSLLAAADASDQSSNVYWDTLWDGYEEEAVYDDLITKRITMGTIGHTEVTYAVLSNAVEATVQVHLKFGTVTIDSTRFHGQITAKIQHFDGESILFNRHGDEALELSPSSDSLVIPLARSIVVLPLYSSLVLNAKLYVVCSLNHEVVFYEKNLVFEARTISSEDIERSSVIVQVPITSEDIQPLQEQSNRIPPAAPWASTPLQTMTSVPQDPANNVLNTTTAKDVTPSVSASEDMLGEATTGDVVDETKSESLSAIHTSESGTVTQNYQDEAMASLDPQTARDKTTKTKEPTTPSPVVSYIPKDTPKNKNRLMAERKGDRMVVVSLAKCVLEGAVIKAKSALVKEKKLQHRSQHVLEFILREFQNIKPLLNVVDEELVNDALVNSWVMQIEEMTYYVDDRMDHIVEMDTESRRLIRRLRRSLKLCGSVVMGQPVNHKVSEIEQLKDRIQEVCRRNVPNSLSIVSSSKTVGVHQQQTAQTSSCTVVISAPQLKILVKGSDGTTTRQGDLTELLTKRHADLQVISLWGTSEDSGRISVIRKSYSDPQVCHDFKFRAWVKLTHPFNPQEFITCLMAQFYAGEYDEKGSLTVTGVKVLMKMESTQGPQLYNEFDSRVSNLRYLVVLEDLSTVPEWDAIMTFLPDRKNGSTIIVSSQQFEVASLCAGRQPHEVLELVQSPTKNVVHAFLKDSHTGDRDKGGLHFSSYEEILLPEKDAAKEWILRHSLVGHELVMHDLGKYLHDAHSNSSTVTSVWGLHGVGKSTLVRSLYCQEMLNDSLFEKFSWVDVSRPFNLRDLSRSLLKYFHPERDPIQECQQLLMKYRCLIVIDDLQTKEEWDLIQAAFVSNSTPCKSVIIVLATEASTATYCADSPKAVFNVKGIEADAASDLLKKEFSSLHQHNSVVDHDSSVVRELILKCGGLPKVIVAIAALLTTKTIRGTNPGFINDKFMEHLETNPGFDGLNKLFSWIHSKIYTAPDKLKACIFYLPIFPRNYIIRRRRLIRRWIAECYSIDIDERSAEEEGENLFSMLLDLGIVQQLPQSVNTVFNESRMILCQINGFIHEYIISRQMEDNSVFELGAGSSLTTQRTGRHLVILKSWDRDRTVFESIDFSRLRSLTVFGKWESFFITKSMRWIHVLDLEGASGLKDEDLVKMVKWLHFLKFLSLRGCSEIRHLPSSLGDLVHLQTLDVRNTSIVTLPESIAKLQELEYIRAGNTVPASTPSASSRRRLPGFLTRSRLVDVLVPSAIGKLTTLHTLGVVNVAASGGKATVKELQKLTQLRKLGVSGINERNGKRFMSAISGHVHLESLSVRLEKNNEHCLDGVALPWENLRSLKLFRLKDKLPESPAGSHVSRIRKVELEMATLTDGNMRFLGLLPELCVIRIKQLQNDVLHFRVMTNHEEEDSFGNVKILQIACGCSPGCLHVDFGSKTMKKLENLKIVCCGWSSTYQFSGLENLRELKQVLLVGGSNALKDQLESKLCDHPNLIKPVVKLEELQRSS